MATESGYDNQKKYGPSQFKTIHNLGSDRFGTHVAIKSLSERFAVAVAIDAVAVSSDTKSIRITKTAHGASLGDICRITSGDLLGAELEIIRILDVDNFLVRNVAGVPIAGDTFKILYFLTNKVDAEGNIITSTGPARFILDGASVEVEEDRLDPNNNKPFPIIPMFDLDGVRVETKIDTADNTQSRPFPLEVFVDVDGEKKFVKRDTLVPANTVAFPVSDADVLLELQAIAALDFATETTLAAGLDIPLSNLETELQAIAALDFATDTTLQEISSRVAGSLSNVDHDEVEITYVGATEDIDTVVLKKATITVATLTMGYDGNGRLNSVVRT